MLTIEFTTYARTNGDSVCTKNEIVLHEDGTWLLHITSLPNQAPIIDLAGQPSTPVGVVIAAIRASFESGGVPQPPPAPDQAST